MSVSTRRVILFVLAPLLVVGALGLVVVWGIKSFLSEQAPDPGRDPAAAAWDERMRTGQFDTPTQLASIAVPHQPNSLAWSADGAYLVAGAWGWAPANGQASLPSEVYVVNVAKVSLASTLEATGVVRGLAFAPDGKWLAVTTTPEKSYGAVPAVLIVFDIPAFTAQFTATSSNPENGFLDLAWAPDSNGLYAIDGPSAFSAGKAEIRHWDVPAFTEKPALRAPQTNRQAALALSPDGRTLALAVAGPHPQLIRMFDIGKASERSSFEARLSDWGAPRLGFTPDGKAIGVLDRDGRRISWWDTATGQSAKPEGARFAAQPAALNDNGPHGVVSPDGSIKARGYEQHPGLGVPLIAEPRFGAFVDVTDTATTKTWIWRVGEAHDISYAPALAFSPDGMKLAGTVKQSSGASIVIWAVPK